MKKDWSEAFKGLSPKMRPSMEFLYSHLPDSDLDCYPYELFLKFAGHAMMVRESCPWCAGLDEEIFNHYVLFPRVNDEDLSFHRKIFYDALISRIESLASVEEQVLEVNRWCHEAVTYESQDDRTASPLTVFRSGSGRCGEESAFLVSALRSVGIPARQVYVPRWAHCDDNHAWVEVLCGDTWRFLGACEPEPILDLGWFNSAASQAVLVHSRLFGDGTSPLHGELIGRDNGVCWYNQTPRYAHVQTYTFCVMHGGAPAANAKIYVQLLNEASYHTIAVLTSDSDGTARIRLGIGDIHVLAVFNGLQAEGDTSGESLVLRLTPVTGQDNNWTEFNAHAPRAASINPTELTDKQKKYRADVLKVGNRLRKARALLSDAKGNAAVISGFLNEDSSPLRKTLVESLTKKDLRDITREVLEDHLQNAPSSGSLSPKIYAAYVLCPRISLEPLTAWRGRLLKIFSEKDKAAWRENPELLWELLKSRTDLSSERTYSNLLWTPYEAWQSGHCDKKSLCVLYVAILRTLGVPSRLRDLDGVPEFWRNGAFHPVLPESTGTLHIVYNGALPHTYRLNWTLSRRTDEGWMLLTVQNGEDTFTLPTGQYRIITSVRLPNGNQFAARRDFTIDEGAAKTVPLYLRSYALADMLCCRNLPVMSAVSLSGKSVPDIARQDKRPSLLLWLDDGGEPTEHILNELTSIKQRIASLPINIIFLLRSRESLKHPTVSKLLEDSLNVSVFFDDWEYDLEHTARLLTCDPSTPPLAVICSEEGQAVYGVSGYHVGSAELLTRIAAYVCGLEDYSERR